LTSTFNHYYPDKSLIALKTGEISSDRSTIVGKNNMLFIYQGTNYYYDSYLTNSYADLGIKWAELTAQRIKKFNLNTKMISLFVPNKASCLPDLYPLPLDNYPSAIWKKLSKCLQSASNVIFSDSLLDASLLSNRELHSPWRYVDSHWTDMGCLRVANEFLTRLGLPEIVNEVVAIDPTPSFGDFSGKFQPDVVFEYKKYKIVCTLPEPVKIFDSGGDSDYTGSVGRRVTWLNPLVPVQLNLLIVGNSFSGNGVSPEHLTYWLARVFSKVTFLHSSSIPIDTLEFYRPDIILFQGLERFMGSIPKDNDKATDIESLFGR